MEELQKLEELNNLLTSALSEYKKRGQDYAKAYKELEEENKTLNERNQYLVKYRAKLEKELYESNENYIPVSLVEEKIEELKEEIEQLRIERNVTYDSGIYRNQIKIDILQELLEKRK